MSRLNETCLNFSAILASEHERQKLITQQAQKFCDQINIIQKWHSNMQNDSWSDIYKHW
jgi:hypothetical protein